MILSISYTLKKPIQSYGLLYEKIKSIGTWCHPLESHWFVESTSEPTVIRDYLLNTGAIDTDDAILVTVVEKGYASQNLDSTVLLWLKQKL
ncbi:MAG: hypothetical protein KC582_04295 [Candidatus Magasanikbacteria bacterium]|nr:hypothetical protein [Candidatus Magasanikbacteria bacterium]MCA9391447.1 hypothetical protein [Candidatus Magasanikbacteria bacterium]HPF95615.1 hypothetical protein [bacterium]